MAVIFSASADTFSANRTSRIIAPILRWLNPNISPGAIQKVQFVVRKGAHMAEYAVLAMLIWRALHKPPQPIWKRRHAITAFAIAVAYAMSDEFHQSFVPSRGAHWGDVLFDSAGAAIGLLVVWVVGCWRRSW
jgi:VanZ family protein